MSAVGCNPWQCIDCQKTFCDRVTYNVDPHSNSSLVCSRCDYLHHEPNGALGLLCREIKPVAGDCPHACLVHAAAAALGVPRAPAEQPPTGPLPSSCLLQPPPAAAGAQPYPRSVQQMFDAQSHPYFVEVDVAGRQTGRRYFCGLDMVGVFDIARRRYYCGRDMAGAYVYPFIQPGMIGYSMTQQDYLQSIGSGQLHGLYCKIV